MYPSRPPWVAPEAIAELRIHPSMRQRIIRYLDGNTDPYLG